MSRIMVILAQRRLILTLALGLSLVSSAAHADLWTTAYYPGYRQSYLPPSKIDFSAVSHIIHFSIMPNANGTLNTGANGLTPAYSADLITHARAAGSKVLICLGGAGSQGGFQGATTSANRSGFITNVVNFMSANGYDGIDIDWEPIDPSDASQYTNLVNELRTALKSVTPRPLLTVATASEAWLFPGLPAMFASLEGQFDQINLMTYDLSGTWPGWVTWFNAPIFNGGYRFPSTGGLVPSTAGMVDDFIAAGVAPGKLGIGIAFYGYLWAGGTGTTTGGAALPRQSWSTAPTNTAIAYFDIMSSYYQTNRYFWDSPAQSAYLSLDNAGSADDKFISYDDEHTCQAKVSYARNRSLGGIMIWELGQGYRSSQPVDQRDPLLQAVKQALATPGVTAIQRTNEDIQLSFATVPLAMYRVQWSSNLSTGTWSTLTSNVPGTGALIQINDPGAAGVQPLRFYRVKTLP